MVDFSVIILVYNEERTIVQVINGLIHHSNSFNVEVLIIDSESTDNTPHIIKQLQKKHRQIKYFRIKRKDFHYADTRNKAVLLAKGKYILFISGDAIPATKNFFQYFSNDLETDKKVMVVFGKHIVSTPINNIQDIETICKFRQLDALTNKEGLFVQNAYEMEKKSIHCNVLFYFLSNVFACYKKSFLLKYPFARVIVNGKELRGKEDISLGKRIIDLGFTKIYDNRCKVVHSNNLSLFQYYRRQKEEFNLMSFNLQTKISNNLICKVKEISRIDRDFLGKTSLFLRLIIFYCIKGFVVLQMRFSRILFYGSIQP